MLTIRGRLITPFILGSMSVGLNILIRHSFYGFMSLDYGLGTMTATICYNWAMSTEKVPSNMRKEYAQNARSDHPAHAQFHLSLCSSFIHYAVSNDSR